ncbi:DTW domain-containing protein [Microbulbifer sp. SA54]|uniref:DTW domain-containing protein n=1 Tax=Microbulbifer sp. SA54 TaxID=3401577 RepID=UPI003AAC51FA
MGVKIILLTHERELDRPSNTGSLAIGVAGGDCDIVRRVVWNRTAPNQELLSEIANENCGLLYPVTEVEGYEVEIADCEQFILLDATWQEARKMYNRSSYLRTVPRVRLRPQQKSRFRLRRNQKESGLCTAECIIEVLRKKGRQEYADEVERLFLAFNKK